MNQDIKTIIKNAANLIPKVAPQAFETKEGHANFVTKTDQAVQDELEKRLIALLPGSKVFGEEKKNQPLTDEPTWVVDPIDGTLNFLHGLHHSAISVALVDKRQVVKAFIYNPYREEMFEAEKGQGAFLNGERIHCANTPYQRAVVGFGTSPYEPRLVNATFKAVNTLMKECADIRRFGAAALDLAYVACGRLDVFFEFALSPWDYAAGTLLIKEAGGQVSLLNLPQDRFDASAPAAVFAANPLCAKEALQVVKAAYENQ